MKYIIGLDIGIASVGYGLIDKDTSMIIDAGVRLFPEGDKDKNANGRRPKRGARRLKRRRIHRLERVKNLLNEYNLLYSEQIPTSTNPYAIRVKGLKEKLTKDELVITLLHLAKRRGIHNVDVTDDESSANELSTKDQINRNAKLLQDSYVAELQLERFNSSSVRGPENRFKTADFVKEAKKLLETQSNYHDIDEDFIDRYIKLLEQRREYYEGPGEGSPYGWKNITEWYEQLVGRCTYYPEQFRSVKHSYTAALFNALNDLNNLTITRDHSEFESSEEPKLVYEEKWQIIENVFKKKKKPTLKQIANEIGVTEDAIKGYRITKTGKPEFTEFKLYHDVKNILDQEQLDNIQILDEIARILTVNQTVNDIVEELDKLDVVFTDEQKSEIAKLTGYTGTHRLSAKLMNDIMDDLWKTPRNQMEIFSSLNIRPKKYNLENKSRIPIDMIDDFILSPAVRRSFIQSIRVVNAIIEKYGLPEDIIIELARENNSDEQRKIINTIQKNREADNKKIEKILAETGQEKVKGMVLKLLLHQQQEGKCLYSLEDIPLDDLIRNPNHYEIDHIIPRSVSFDDSRNNKVLVKQVENSKKGNMTPFQYLSSGKSSLSYNQFKTHVLNLSKSKDLMSKKKRDYLLEERDISRYDVQKDFINRNLVDTRYTTRELLGLLKAYFAANELDVKVKSINGSFTNHMRKIWRFHKDRDAGYKHHAEDALVVASSEYLFDTLEFFKKQEKLQEEHASVETEENVHLHKPDDDRLDDELYTIKRKLVDDIKNFENYKYSHRVDKKPNRQFLNETIYSTRKNEKDEDVIIQKMKNIYDGNNDSLKTKFESSPEKFLMYKHDPKTFEKLSEIMNQYANEKNPLAAYYNETGKKLTKYSKKDNGPIVESLKYEGKKVGVAFDISDKYNSPKNKVVQLSLKPYRFDVYLDNNMYKFITISYIDLNEQKDFYHIPKHSYKNKLSDNNISEDGIFVGSFHFNDLIEINNELYKVVGVNNDILKRIELNLTSNLFKLHKQKETGENKNFRLIIGFSKNIKSIKKYNSDVLGNLYIDNQKSPKLKIRK